MPGPMLRWFLVLCILISNCLPAQPFFFRKDIRVADAPYAIVPGDFNGDGRPDLAVGAQDGVYVLLNAGGGNFGRPVRTEAAPRTFWLGAGADFNGDGRDDLVGSGFLYLSRGDGTFQPPRYLGQEAVAAGDFNRDGKTDLVISNYIRGEGVRILLGNGDGTLRSGAVVSSTPMEQVQVADFNRDGRTDVAAILLEEPRAYLLVFLGQGDGAFGPERRTEMLRRALFFGSLVLLADFNGDGLPDILTGDGYGTLEYLVMLGNGDGSFQPPVRSASELYEFRTAAADFTGDGYADLMVRARGRYGIRPGKGDGTLLPPVELPVAVGVGGTVVDLDGDGRLDLVTANLESELSLLISRAQWRPELRRAVSAARDLAIVVPGSLASLYTPTPATANESASPPWPTRLAGISLEVHDSAGTTRLAPLFSVSPTQINFQVPAGVALGEATLAIAHGGGTTLAGSMEVAALAPGLFPGFTGLMVEPDGTQVPIVVVLRPDCWGCAPELPSNRPVYLSFFGTGFPGANTANVTCSLNGVPVPVLYAGPQETPGVDQINVRLLPEVLETDWWPEVLATIRIAGVPANRLVSFF